MLPTDSVTVPLEGHHEPVRTCSSSLVSLTDWDSMLESPRKRHVNRSSDIWEASAPVYLSYGSRCQSRLPHARVVRSSVAPSFTVHFLIIPYSLVPSAIVHLRSVLPYHCLPHLSLLGHAFFTCPWLHRSFLARSFPSHSSVVASSPCNNSVIRACLTRAFLTRAFLGCFFHSHPFLTHRFPAKSRPPRSRLPAP